MKQLLGIIITELVESLSPVLTNNVQNFVTQIEKLGHRQVLQKN